MSAGEAEIEAVARALTASWGMDPEDSEILGVPAWHAHEAEARAAIRALAAKKEAVSAPLTASDIWTKWEGGECPVAEGARVEVKFRNGEAHKADRPERLWWVWCESGASLFDIVAYRIVGARDA